jgi:hypothetical protein
MIEKVEGALKVLKVVEGDQAVLNLFSILITELKESIKDNDSVAALLVYERLGKIQEEAIARARTNLALVKTELRVLLNSKWLLVETKPELAPRLRSIVIAFSDALDTCRMSEMTDNRMNSMPAMQVAIEQLKELN